MLMYDLLQHCLLSEDLYRMAVDVGNAVQYMHSVMYIHRCGNIMHNEYENYPVCLPSS